ncbi:META domain-containing protein [uncultured Psychrobacter sp.]|uniref:META domain-containing protein n=1 Tax=uncultured Psychrobacter sp. TaxID=259303 RepID=UPI00345AF3A8
MKNSSINAYTLILTGLFSAVVLTGCQTTTNNSTQSSTIEESEPVNEMDALIKLTNNESNKFISSWKLPELPVSVLNQYDWQLVEWIDNQHVVTQVNTEQPLMMDVRPSNLVFTYDCQRYSVAHSNYSDYNYSSYGISKIVSLSCPETSSTNLNHSFLSRQLQSDNIESYLNTTFAPYGRSRFSFELLPPKPKAYQLGLKLHDTTLVFEGTPKKLQPTSGLPISYEFLKRYKWRLVSAVGNDNKTIIELSRPGFPVIAYFGYMFNDEHHVGFSSDCNGVGGPYTLTPDNVLFIGSGPQTMMGCGPKREAAEDKIRALELSSASQLTLKQYSDINVDDPTLPYYLLIQKFDTGETLIWKNSEIVIR